jgi:hypothetical protein
MGNGSNASISFSYWESLQKLKNVSSKWHCQSHKVSSSGFSPGSTSASLKSFEGRNRIDDFSDDSDTNKLRESALLVLRFSSKTWSTSLNPLSSPSWEPSMLPILNIGRSSSFETISDSYFLFADLIFIHIEHTFCICPFLVTFFSATIDGRNLIFGHKRYGKRSLWP